MLVTPRTAALQGWSSAAVRTVQLCVACNMPYLDMNYNLAPRAELANGAPQPDSRECLQALNRPT